MKFRPVLILSFACLALSECSKIDELLTFTISDQTNFTVESSSPLNLPLDIVTPEVTTDSEQQFENNNTSASLVKDVRLQELRLTITDPAGKTFSFLKSVQLYISTNSSDEIELAYLADIPSDVTTITLTTTGEKLDTYIKASSYKLRTRVVTRESLTQSIDIRSDLSFKVTAAPL